MRVLIGVTFKHEKENRLFVKGKDYSVDKELGKWIARKRLGIIIPEVKTDGKGKPYLKDIVKDRMVHEGEIEIKQKKKNKIIDLNIK